MYIPHGTMLNFIVLPRYCGAFYFCFCVLPVEILQQPGMGQVYQRDCSTAFAHFVSLRYILVILVLFQKIFNIIILGKYVPSGL